MLARLAGYFRPLRTLSALIAVCVFGAPLFAAPRITSLSPTTGNVGTSVTISGSGFGSTQGSSTVTFNGVTATPTSWASGKIVAPVPSAATTGNVVVTVSGAASSGVKFTVTPKITSLSPGSGAVGASVTITGSGFGSTQGTSTVKFNGTTATPSSWGATSIVTPVPTGATTGNVVVTVNSVASSGVSFTVVPAPSISGLSPNSGAVGASVTINGSNFGSTQGMSTISFNGTLVTPSSWSASSVVAPVPSGATTGNVVVHASGVNSNGVNFTVVPAPSISSVSPTSGAVGASATISGSNFGSTQGAGTISFNGIQASPTSWSATSIVTSVPGGATTGNVVVNASGVNSNGIPFTVVPAPSITSLSPTSGAVGSSVTISGSNFGGTQGAGTVSFNGALATPTSWGAGSIIAPVPAGATSGNVVVHASGVNSNGVPFTILPTPNISSLSPSSGPVGASITITGTSFGTNQGTSTVTFNGTSATPSSWSDTSIVAPVQSGATSGNVVVMVNGVASNGVSFTVSPFISSLSPTSGAVGASVTISGSSFGATQGSSTVKFNGTSATPSSWGDRSIVAPVPNGATTGNVVVNANGMASNGVNFTVATNAGTLQSITVSPASASVAAGNTQPFTATGTYSDNSTQDVTTTATWTSSDPTVAVIDAAGNATALDNGQVVIQAVVGSVSGSASLTVTPGQLDAIVTPVPSVFTSRFGVNQKAIGVGADGFTRFAV